MTANGKEAYTNNNTEELYFTISDDCFDVSLSGTTMTVKVQKSDMKRAVLAGYDNSGKMVFSYMIADASVITNLKVDDAASIKDVVLYPIDDNYCLDDDKKIITWPDNQC